MPEYLEQQMERERDNIVYTMELRWHGNGISSAGVWRWLVRWVPELSVIRRRSTSRSVTPSGVCCRCCLTAWMAGWGSRGRQPGSRWRYWGLGEAVDAVIVRAYRGSVARRTWTEPRRDFRLCRWQSRFPDRIGSCCSGLPAARGSPSFSYSWVGPDISAAKGRSINMG